MESRIDVHTADRRAEWRISGQLTRDSLLAGWSAFISHPDWSPSLDLLVLIDREAQLADIEFDDILVFQAHIEKSRRDNKRPVGVRTALVSEKREHWPLLQLHTMSFAERTLSDDAVFDDESEARAWLAERRQVGSAPPDTPTAGAAE